VLRPRQETAALRISSRLLSGVDHSRPMRSQPPEHVCCRSTINPRMTGMALTIRPPTGRPI